ncbi:MAG: CPBP family intramembrane metalloprotease [Chloroflexi bacterium]|nr:CPBP family intramembrane metalloprotease [Chloroflexota bacterium]
MTRSILPNMASAERPAQATAAELLPPRMAGLLSWPSAAAIAAVGFAALLIAYNNVLYVKLAWAFPSPWILYPRAVLLPALALFWALRVRRLSWRELGLAGDRGLSGAASGLAAAVVAAAPVALFLVVASQLFGSAFAFRNIDGVSDDLGYALFWAFVLYPLHTVIFEEVLFRGVLQGLATRAFGAGWGIVLPAGAFALWHPMVNYQVLGEARIAEHAPLFAGGVVLALAGIFLGGLVMGAMRHYTNSLLAPIVFHWAFLVSLGGVLFLLAQ